MAEHQLTQARLKEVLHYCQETGVFTWLSTGKTAGNISPKGYQRIGINKRTYLAHRLAWLYVHGDFPCAIDHINRNKLDNRMCNLRQATQAENMLNISMNRRNTSGSTGVSWSKVANKWHAYISLNKRRLYLGLYEKLEDAKAAYLKAKADLHLFENTKPRTQNELVS